MKHLPKLILAFFLVVSTFLSGFAQEFPANQQKLVNDFTNTLTSNQIALLEQKLVAFDDSTSNQIAVVLVKTVGDYDINEYALELGRKWGVGSQGKNNGVILLVAVGDRKLSIQTGYGLEGALPDIYTKRIIENDIKPHFIDGDYFQGINAGTNSIMSLIKGEYKNDKKKAKSPINKGGSGLIIIIIVIIIFVLGKRGGGGKGGNGEVFSGRGIAEGIFWGMLLGGGRGHHSRGGFGGGGFGGSGGGFGGFGGGSFGGGGSSGSW